MMSAKVMSVVMNYMFISIMTVFVIGVIFVVASLKSRTRLDTPILSNNAKFIIGFSLMFGGFCVAVTVLLKGGF